VARIEKLSEVLRRRRGLPHSALAEGFYVATCDVSPDYPRGYGCELGTKGVWDRGDRSAESHLGNADLFDLSARDGTTIQWRLAPPSLSNAAN